jgi:protein-tyrosine phosphatase
MASLFGKWRIEMLLPSPILFICAGNLCRSPFAEAYMRKRLEAGEAYAECFSRGLLSMPGRKVPAMALKVAQEFGVDLSGHVSQTLLAPDFDRAALVMVMESGQRQHLSKMRPAHIGKVMMLSQPSGGQKIDDPMGRSEETFHRVYGEIVEHIDVWAERFGVEHG